MRLIVTLLLSLCSFAAFAQSKYSLSDAIDIPQEGWNKVLMMRNGNTLLFHFEFRKGIVVKVFNAAHKEIASEKHLCSILDINALDKAALLGAYDINGEAVLFFTQMYLNRNTLIRLRINADNGKLVEESQVIESRSLSDRTNFGLLKDPNSDNYYVVCYHGIHFYSYSQHVLIEYNGKHEKIKEVPISINDSTFRNIHLMDMQICPSGAICIYMLLTKPDVSASHETNINGIGTTYYKTLSLFYLPKDGKNFIEKRIELDKGIYPVYAISSYNPFTNSMNIALANGKKDYYMFGLNETEVIDRSTLLFMTDENDLSTTYKWIQDDSISNAFQRTDTSNSYQGIPIAMYTNNHGITTMVSAGFYGSYYFKGEIRWPMTYLRGLGTTRLNSSGEEIDGKLLWLTQMVPGSVRPFDLLRKDRDKQLLRAPTLAYTQEFMCANSYIGDKSLRIVYNDTKDDFSRPLNADCDTVYDFSHADACYLTLNDKKELVKKHLFDAPAEGESNASFLESADYDDKTNTYTSLVSCRKGKDISIKMAWCHLE